MTAPKVEVIRHPARPRSDWDPLHQGDPEAISPATIGVKVSTETHQYGAWGEFPEASGPEATCRAIAALCGMIANDLSSYVLLSGVTPREFVLDPMGFLLAEKEIEETLTRDPHFGGPSKK